MTIQDIIYIMIIGEERSINKAAERLFVSQPSLSKCIKKVENEYGITIFERSRGSTLTLTEEGRCFMDMGAGVLQYHKLFENEIARLHMTDSRNIVFACPMQRAYSMSGPVMKWIYEHYPEYSMEVKTVQSKDMVSAVSSGTADIGLYTRDSEPEGVYSEKILQVADYIYLRSSADVLGKTAGTGPNGYPLLSLKALDGETFVVNQKGTGSRAMFDRIIQKAGIAVNIRENPVHSLRVAMVNAGHASMIISDDALMASDEIDRSRIFEMLPGETIEVDIRLVCRNGFRRDPRFPIIREAVRAYYGLE